ncbi:MAG: CBS domain-containing protein [Candidatus Aenigmatarchaeota archaeon]|nr:CBS domain-containing protein [Candidatus Aenigmarchaeota archaeon]
MIFIKEESKEKNIYDFSTKNVVYQHNTTKIIDVAKNIIKTNHRRQPIIKKNLISKNVVGIITAMDILDAFLRGVSFDKKIEEIMIRDFIFCYKDDSVKEIIKKFQYSRRGGFPVFDKKNNLVGIITENDIISIIDEDGLKNKIKFFMTKKPFFVKTEKIIDSVKNLVNAKYRKLPIVDSNIIRGIVTDRICLKEIIEGNDLNRLNTEVCIKDIAYVEPDDDVMAAIEIMEKNKIGGLPVIENNKLVGIITERDIIDKIKVT